MDIKANAVAKLRLEAWVNDTPPPNDNPSIFNHPVSLEIDNHGTTVTGVISWDATVSQYAFFHAEQRNDGTWASTEAQVDEISYCAIRDMLRATTGIHVTRGLNIISQEQLEAYLTLAERETAGNA